MVLWFSEGKRKLGCRLRTGEKETGKVKQGSCLSATGRVHPRRGAYASQRQDMCKSLSKSKRRKKGRNSGGKVERKEIEEEVKINR